MEKLKQMTDDMLVTLYLKGNNSAFDILLNRHQDRLFNYIYFLVRSREVAEDIFQETFVKAVRVIDQGRYTDQGRFLSWVMRIAHNQVIDHFRSQRKDHVINESEAGYDIIGTMRFSEPTTEDELVHGEMEQTIRDLIDLLPEEQQEVVRLRYYSKLSFQEIAEHTDVSINTALGRMRYALINMRQMIKKRNLVLC